MADKAPWIPPATGGGVQSDEADLKIVRGTVSAAGAVIEGTGYTPTQLGTGQYDVTFTDAFTDVPSIVVTHQSGGIIHSPRVTGITAAGFSVALFDTTNALVDTAWAFIAIGPDT